MIMIMIMIIRCQALRLLSALANTEPEFQVELESSGGSSIQTNRLVDDVFSRTCQVRTLSRS